MQGGEREHSFIKRVRSGTSHLLTSHDIQSSRQSSRIRVTDISFYLDSTKVFTDSFIDPYEFPDIEVAEKLFNCYTNTVHPFFPLVSQPKCFAREKRADGSPHLPGIGKLRGSVP